MTLVILTALISIVITTTTSFCCGALGRDWHLTDMSRQARDVRFEVRSGHGAPHHPDHLRRF
jgi:hypothetical protein